MKIFEGLLHIKPALASGFLSQPWFLHKVIFLSLLNFSSFVEHICLSVSNTKLTSSLFFSTMIPGERVVSNLSRAVVIIWCFVVLILTQSYTASLASLLTVQQLQPTVTDVHELIKKGEYVGYLEGSFVPGILLDLGFDKSKLVVYNSIEQCDGLLSKGSANGGIAAAFDEVPYMRLFLSKYCSKYAMIDPTFKTDGFGFVSLFTPLRFSFCLVSKRFVNPEKELLACCFVLCLSGLP